MKLAFNSFTADRLRKKKVQKLRNNTKQNFPEQETKGSFVLPQLLFAYYYFYTLSCFSHLAVFEVES